MYGISKLIQNCNVNIYLIHSVFNKRLLHTCVYNFNKVLANTDAVSHTDQLLEKHKDELYYCDFVENNKFKFGYLRNAVLRDIKNKKIKKEYIEQQSKEPLPLSLKYVADSFSTSNFISSDEVEPEVFEQPSPQFPFQENNERIAAQQPLADDCKHDEDNHLDLEVKTRLELYNKSKDHLHWMEHYENYELNDNTDVPDQWMINYGTADPTSKISNVPCGGCGALLHCKDTVIPGYIPSELFKNYKKPGGVHLKAMICQRCHFLKHYNLALQVRVSSDDYPLVLQTIGQRQRALVVLIVDLLDFPCCIWPGIADIIGSRCPIIVVGNKVDLLPQDGKGYLQRVIKNLENSVRECGFGMFNIKHISLISAKTGYGIEELITKLQYLWQYKGDVFLVGCTNVGKSSLFNALLQSDYCKTQADDLIQRATTSPWPGTTLNLLKFPISRPTGWRLYVRTKRLVSAKAGKEQEKNLLKEQLRQTKNSKYATLMGHIDRSFPSSEPVDEANDIFAVSSNLGTSGSPQKIFDDTDKDHVLSKWCYDTPGVVQSDQIIHLLTTEEIVRTFPNRMITPRTFSLQPGSSIFIAGLARMDYLEGTDATRFTVFCSKDLPVTICKLSKADEVYNEFLNSEVFGVPLNYPERLKLWPGLQPSRNFTITGIDKEMSAADMVLSSAGWVAITPSCGAHCTIQGWTPERRGIYMRDSLLPKAVSLRGQKIRKSCAYKSDGFYLK